MLKLGQTLQQVRQSFPAAVFERTWDGDGINLVRITLPDQIQILSRQDEGDEDVPINWQRKIIWLSTAEARCRTADGIHPDMRLPQAADRLGGIERLILSEIESREYVLFKRQTPFNYRTQDAGIYTDPERIPPAETTRYRQQAKITEISVYQ